MASLWQILPLPTTGASQQDLEELEKSNNVDVIYLDFAKAFDKVDHGIFTECTLWMYPMNVHQKINLFEFEQTQKNWN